MKYLNKFSIIILVFTLALLSCKKDFEEINHNPHGFTTASDGSLFNSIIQSLIISGGEHFYINDEILYKQTQLGALTVGAWGNYSIGTEEMWSNYYRKMSSFRELEKRFDELPESGEVLNMKAMLKIVLAYKTFKLTDMFGDIPFSMAGYGFQDLEYLHPKFDTQESIYKFLLEELKWCDENINDTAVTEPFNTFKSFDPLFNGDLSNWQKLANSLRLRYAMRMSGKEPELAGEIILDIVENKRPVFIGSGSNIHEDAACLWPSKMGYSDNHMSWSFRENKNLRMGSNIWHILSANDSTDGSGIFDPRAYIFFEGNNNNEWVAFPQLADASTPISGGVPYGSHRDNTAGYAIKGSTCIYSPFGYFYIRDPSFMPNPLITGAEVHFILAEAYFRGIGVSQNSSTASNEYLDGMKASIKWWKGVSDNSQLPSSGLKFPDKVVIPSGLDFTSVQNVYGLWMATSDEEKLEFIYLQRYIDAIRQPWEVFSLARRTGATPREGDPLNYFRLPYPPSEVEYNSANWAEAISNQGGGDSPEYKIWWMP